MGEGTLIKPGLPQNNARTSKEPSGLHSLFFGMDIALVLVVAALLIIGLLMVYSSSWNFSLYQNQPTSFMALRQVMWAVVGVVIALIISRFDYRRFQPFLIPMMAFTILSLVIVLWVSENRFGAVRTLFFGSVQPSELAKLATIIYLSYWLFSKREILNDVTFGLIPMGVILGINAGLILLQPDLSAAFTVIILGGILFYIAGGDMKQITFVVLIVAILVWILITVNPTGSSRLTKYVSGLRDPEQADYHVYRALEAVVRGGLFGVGIGNSSTKLTGLPVPWTDSIFAVIAEETGLVGAAGVLCLYVILLWRGLKIAENAPDLFGKLLAAGITIWISIEAMINMGVLINLLPFAGNALPLISAGGSSLVTVMIGIGILMSISRASTVGAKFIGFGGNTSAVVNLRWRNGRGSVPRTRRPANHE